MPIRIADIGRSRSVSSTGPPLLVAPSPLLTPDSSEPRKRPQRPEAADQHRADADVAHLLGPDQAGRRCGVDTGQLQGERRILAVQECVVDRNEQPPCDQAAGDHHEADVQADDVADAEQGGRQVDADVGDRALADVAGEGERLGQELEPGHRELEQRAGRGRHPE
jgi:hypothetical protein